MISAALLGTLCWLGAAGFMLYGLYKGFPEDTTPHRNARYAAVLAGLLLIAGSAAFAWSAFDSDSPAPVPGPVDPDVPTPNPPAPTPSAFDAQIQAAFRADGGTRNQALILGGLADQFGELVPINPEKFKTHEDVGAQWEKLRALWLPEVSTWAPKTTAVFKGELAGRGLVQLGTLDDAGRKKHGEFYEDVGEALLEYE
jgi:hypothetical protein